MMINRSLAGGAGQAQGPDLAALGKQILAVILDATFCHGGLPRAHLDKGERT